MRLVMSGILIGALAATAAAGGTPSTGQPAAVPVTPAPSPPPPVAPLPPPAPPAMAPVGKQKSPVPSNKPASWVTTNDYPPASLRANESGTVAFRLTINPQGQVSACKITMSSGHPLLDQATCLLVTRRASFTPARNARGRPTIGTYSNRVRWMVPTNSEPRQIFLDTVVQTFVVETDGSIGNCRFVLNGTEQSDAQGMNVCGRGTHYKPFVDSAGNPVRRKVTMQMTVTLGDPDK